MSVANKLTMIGTSRSGSGKNFIVQTSGLNLYVGGRDIAVSPVDDSIVIATNTSNDGLGLAADVGVIKYDSSGNYEWVSHQWQNSNCGASSVIVRPSGAISITGNVISPVSQNATLISTLNASDGTRAHNTYYHRGSTQTYGMHIDADSSNNMYIAGLLGNYTPISVLKYNSGGVNLFQKEVTISGASRFIGYGCAFDNANSNFYIAGYSNHVGGVSGLSSNVGILLSYSDSGTQQWGKVFGTSSSDIAWACAHDSNGDVIVAGYTNNVSAYNSGFVAKFDSTGTLLWSKTHSYSDHVYYFGCAVDADDNIIAHGKIVIGGVSCSVTTKMDSSGSILWDKSISYSGGNFGDEECGVAVNSFGDIVFTSELGSDVVAVQLAPEGENLGTFGDFTLADINLTEANGSFISGTPSGLTDVTPSMTWGLAGINYSATPAPSGTTKQTL
jgi:hypothetical protein